MPTQPFEFLPWITEKYKKSIIDRLGSLIEYYDDLVKDLTEERDGAEKKLRETKEKLEMMIAKYE